MPRNTVSRLYGSFMFSFKMHWKAFPGWLYHLILTPATYDWSSFLSFLPAFGVVTVFYFSHLDRYVCSDNLTVVLIRIYLIANVEQLFVCFICHLYILFCEMSSSHLPIFCFFFFFLIELLEFFVFWRYQTFVRYVTCKYFLPVFTLPFKTLNWIFCSMKVLNFDEV